MFWAQMVGGDSDRASKILTGVTGPRIGMAELAPDVMLILNGSREDDLPRSDQALLPDRSKFSVFQGVKGV